MAAPPDIMAYKADLEGQHANSTNWGSGPLIGWKELDTVPFRALHTGGPVTNQLVTIDFDHTTSFITIPGIQNLFEFTPSPNVIITDGPTLVATPGVDIWSYNYTITLTNNQPGYVEFKGRISAGAHLFPGASLNLRLLPTGQMQISKPAAAAGTPDLVLTKSGPAQAETNQVLTYALYYTNKITSPDTGLGVQVTDILPPQVTYVPGSGGPGCTEVGNTLIWDLPNLTPGQSGLLTYKVILTNNIPVTTTFTNHAQIQSSQNDGTPEDNIDWVITTVVVNASPEASDDAYVTGRNQLLTIPEPGVLTNDTDAVSAVLFSGPGFGSLTFGTNGSFTYVPNTNFTGIDVFAYQAVNGFNTSGPALVTITVTNTCDFTVSTNILVNNDPALCGAIVNYAAPIVSGSCFPVVCTPPSGSLFPIGTTTVTCTNADGISKSFQVTVLDAESPTINCPGAIELATDAGQCSRSNVTYLVSFNDNCPAGAALVQTAGLPSGATFPKGITTNVFTVADASGHSNSCSFTVTINDVQPPALTCPPDLEVNSDPGACFATGIALGSPAALDNCGPATVTNNAPVQFPIGTNLVTWIATDNDGNQATCIQRVIVRDAQLPVITCPSDIAVDADTNACSVTAVALGQPVCTDNCAIAFVTSNAPPQFPVGTNLVVWTATDTSGNLATCVQRVIVRDAQLPLINCPADLVLDAAPGLCFATNVLLGTPISSDNCGVVSISSNAPPQFAVGTNFVQWTATDASGNSSFCIQQVVVRDTQPPLLTCPPDLALSAAPGLCFATNVLLGTPTFSDNCGAVTLTSNAPPQFAIGINLVTWTATDNHGNQATCLQRVVVLDDQLPTITCPPIVAVNAAPGLCFATNVVLGDPISADNCGVATVTSNAPPQFGVGTNLVAWTATDTSGNIASCIQQVVVRDAENPLIDCPVNVIVDADPGLCFAANVPLGTPICSDNCGISSVASNAPPQFAVGTNFVQWTATDASGNSSSCIQRIVVRDTQPPLLTCPPSVITNASEGLCFATNVFLGDPICVENCGTVTITNDAPAQFSVGTNLVTWNATDASGNMGTCLQQVVVLDTQHPQILCPPDINLVASPGESSLVVAYPPPVATDNCSIAAIDSLPAPGSSFPLGPTTVTATARDAAGNTATCAFIITVARGNYPPVAVSQSLTTVESMPVSVTLTGTDQDNDPLTFALLSNPAHGVITGLNTDTGALLYTPDTAFLGTDTFTFTVNDGRETSLPATVTINVTPQADIAVLKSGDVEGRAGDILNFSISVTNLGPSTATNVVAFDQLPLSYTFISADPAPAAITNNLVTWAPFDLLVQSNRVFTIVARPTVGGVFENVAFATSNIPDPFMANNDGSWTNSRLTTFVQPLADVAIAKAGPAIVAASPVFTYDITVVNYGPVAATNVAVQDVLPGGLSIIEAPGGTAIENTFVAFLPVLDIGATVTFRIVVLASTPGQYVNTAIVTSATPDPNLANNASSVFTIVQPENLFGLTQGTNWLNTQTGLFEQRVTVTNQSWTTIAAFRLLVGDIHSLDGTPRSNVFLKNATGTNTDGRPYVQYNAPLDPGSNVTLILEFKVLDRLPFTNSLEAIDVLPTPVVTNTGPGILVDKAFIDNRSGAPRFVIEWTAVPGATYTIIYSDTGLGGPWLVATPSITAAASRVQWYDDGPPKTLSPPGTAGSRYYRVIEVITND